jgi:hypothetical protein
MKKMGKAKYGTEMDSKPKLPKAVKQGMKDRTKELKNMVSSITDGFFNKLKERRNIGRIGREAIKTAKKNYSGSTSMDSEQEFRKGGAKKSKMMTGGMVNSNAKVSALKTAGSKGTIVGANPKAIVKPKAKNGMSMKSGMMKRGGAKK